MTERPRLKVWGVLRCQIQRVFRLTEALLSSSTPDADDGNGVASSRPFHVASETKKKGSRRSDSPLSHAAVQLRRRLNIGRSVVTTRSLTVISRTGCTAPQASLVLTISAIGGSVSE